MRKRQVEVAVENIIMYIPVAELTLGDIPMPKRMGLKIEPPPNPRAPDTKPPPNPITTNLIVFELVNIMSDSTSPLFNFIFNAYSFLRIISE